MGSLKRNPAFANPLKIFGERNTSTNALKRLIEANSDSRVLPSVAQELSPTFTERDWRIRRLPHGEVLAEHYIDFLFWRSPAACSWKHAATYFPDIGEFAEYPVIFTVRHPASWLLALHRRPYNSIRPVPDNFRDFLDMDWQTLRRDRLKGAVLSPITLYNVKIASYLEFCSKLNDTHGKYIFVRFEDFAINQQDVFLQIKGLISNPAERPSLIRESTKDAQKGIDFYKEYYGNEKWKNEIDRESSEKINKLINWNQLTSFNYGSL